LSAFIDIVKKAFNALEALGYPCQEGPKTLVAQSALWRGPHASVIVTLGADGLWQAGLGRTPQETRYDIDEVYEAEDLVLLEGGQEALKAWKIQSPQAQSEAMAAYLAKVVAKHCALISSPADLEALFARLDAQRTSLKRQYRDRYLRRHDFPPEAWGNR
jgi:hypothetical protein